MMIPPSRRGVVAGLLCAGMSQRLLATAPPPSLATLAAAKGLLFGTSVGAGRPGSLTGMLADPQMMAIVAHECGTIVAENEMKQYVVAARPDTLDFAPGDRIADWATAHGKRMRGHTLLWNHPRYTPAWLEQRYADAPPDALARWLTDYVGSVAGHYGTRVYAWDVVNETIDPATGALRDTLFQRKLGFEAIRLAFTTAKARAPHARLVYNDYMSWGTGGAKHRAGVLALLRRFRDEGVPCDALGIQSHLGTEQSTDALSVDMVRSRERERDWRAFVDAVVGMGYRLALTEFDVGDRDLGGTIAQRDAQVAAVASDYLTMMLSYRQVDELLCWGLVDRYSWLQNFSPRRDGAPLRPCPFDSAYRAKPLRTAIARAIAAAPARADAAPRG